MKTCDLSHAHQVTWRHQPGWRMKRKIAAHLPHNVWGGLPILAFRHLTQCDSETLLKQDLVILPLACNSWSESWTNFLGEKKQLPNSELLFEQTICTADSFMLLLLSRALCDFADIFAAPYHTSATASAAHLNGAIIFKELMQLWATSRKCVSRTQTAAWVHSALCCQARENSFQTLIIIYLL